MGLFGKSDEDKVREQNAQLAENRKKVEAARRKHQQEQQAAAAKAAAPATAAKPAVASATAPATATPAAGTYTVKSGDSLSKIAKKQLGDAGRWREIYDANREVIGANPDLIKPGQQLRLPSAAPRAT